MRKIGMAVLTVVFGIFLVLQGCMVLYIVKEYNASVQHLKVFNEEVRKVSIKLDSCEEVECRQARVLLSQISDSYLEYKNKNKPVTLLLINGVFILLLSLLWGGVMIYCARLIKRIDFLEFNYQMLQASYRRLKRGIEDASEEEKHFYRN